MKKNYLLSIFISIFLLIGLTKGASTNLINTIINLESSLEFGYINVNDLISVKSITESKLELKSPLLKDKQGTTLTKSMIMYSQKPLDDILSISDINSSIRGDIKEKVITLSNATGTEFTLELNASTDGIDASKTYYVSVLPEDVNGKLGEFSNELCFKLDSKAHGEGSTCNNLSSLHGAAGANMTLANISHTVNGNKVRLRWIALEGSDSIDIFLRDKDEEVYDKLGTVNMNAESFEFTTRYSGEHTVKFTPNNGGTEKIYTFLVGPIPTVTTPSPTPTTPTPSVTTVPKVGPKENIIAIIVISALGYFFYRRTRKH